MDFQVKQVKITHFINPSLFYYRDLSKEQDELVQIVRVEEHLAKVAENARLNCIFDPKPNDMVAYLHNKKWIRCEVDAIEEFMELSSKKVLVLWACDYGVPFHTSNFSNIIPLPSQERYPRPMINKGGLSVLPATLRFDHVNCSQATVYNEQWLDRALNIFKGHIGNAKEVLFYPSQSVSHPEVIIGDLLIGDQSMVDFGLGSKLLEAEVAITVPNEEFLKRYSQLFTHIIERWNDNSRSGGVLKNPAGVRNEDVDLNYDKFKDSDLNDSSIGEDNLQSVYQKVLCWQNRCDNVSAKEDPEDSEVFDIFDVLSTRDPFHTVFKEPQKAKSTRPLAPLTFKAIETTFSDDSSYVCESVRSAPKGPIFLAAGASIQSNIQKYRKPGHEHEKTHSEIVVSETDDDHFESVSQRSYHEPKNEMCFD